ncbi:tRNA pseudouridine(55) synthase TruB [Chitinophaga agri]|uniref:tRNA pseudouridine synthase B n=1 Tax=Chitinophaga agri TaxID=2703787 RepID=A0A6B9ZKQ0_9BACT|nr:tRNA pseudouridine(55) synthase TruB [Chitinophaga agri]QHS62497.1 tRNA pseudouridine(55) synthase TruB [Chitinophaga agri]
MNQTAEKNIYEEGQVILINKPLTWTSFDVVRKIRNTTKAKTGHAGTLDPLATGLLICCTGKMTKKINEYQAQEKEYTGTFTIGAVTPTYDLESEPTDFKSIDGITEQMIHEVTKQFLGEQQQLPPIHSAIKQNGKPIYELARKGVEVKVEPRTVFIKEFEITAIEMPVIHFRVVCSTGTYIRSLSNDFGAALGVGGYMSSLCRTRIGDFKLENAWEMDKFIEEVGKGKVKEQQ